MGSVRATSTTLSAYIQLRYIRSTRSVCATSARFYPSRRDRFHGRSRANVRHRAESAREAHSKVDVPAFSHNAGPLPAKWRCLPKTHACRNWSPACDAVSEPVPASQHLETRARRSVLFSGESPGSTAPLPRRSPSKRSHRMVSGRVPPALGARTIPEGRAPRAPRVADLESSLLNFLFGLFPRLSCRGRFPVGAATLRMGRFVVFVGANDLLHQVVPHHVSLSELHHADACNLAAHLQRFDQPALLPLW